MKKTITRLARKKKKEVTPSPEIPQEMKGMEKDKNKGLRGPIRKTLKELPQNQSTVAIAASKLK